MTQQFTASEVRDYLFSIEERSSRQWLIAHDAELGMLRQFADLLEARERAVPIGWVFQHEETGLMTFCENDGVNNAENFAANNPRHVLCGPAFTHPASPDAERLAEALERTARHRAAADRIDPDQWRSVLYSWEDRALAAHSAQAQPPAARVPDAETLRLHLGELTPDEVCVAKAAYRLALAHRRTPMADMTLEQARDWLNNCAISNTPSSDISNEFLGELADAIDAAIKQREQDKEDAVHSGIAMALGWMYQEACRTADAGLDIRTARLTDLLERALRDLAPKESGNG